MKETKVEEMSYLWKNPEDWVLVPDEDDPSRFEVMSADLETVVFIHDAEVESLTWDNMRAAGCSVVTDIGPDSKAN